MATIPVLKGQVDTVIRQETGLHSVTRDEVSDQFDAGFDELNERGVVTVASTAAMSAQNSNDTKKVLVVGNGIFHWVASGSADGVDTFSATGGGFYTRSFSNSGGGGGGYFAKNSNTLYPTLGERIGLGGINDAESNIHIALETGDDLYATVEPDNYLTNYAGAAVGQKIQQRWRYGSHRFEDVNVDGRPNVVHSYGYNAETAGARESTDDAGWQMRHESHYQIFGGSGFFEFHLPEVYSVDTRWTRIMSHYVDKSNGACFSNYIIPSNNWMYNKPTVGEVYQFASLSGRSDDGSYFILNSESSSGSSGYQCNYTLDGNTVLGSLLLELGQGDENTVRLISQNTVSKQNRISLICQALELPFDQGGIKKMVLKNQAGIVSDGSLLIGTPGYPDGVTIGSAIEAGSWEAAHASAVIEVRSTTKGSRPIPAMTTAQFTAISSKLPGLMSYSSDDKGILFFDEMRVVGFRYNGTKFQGYDGATWSDLN